MQRKGKLTPEVNRNKIHPYGCRDHSYGKPDEFPDNMPERTPISLVSKNYNRIK